MAKLIIAAGLSGFLLMLIATITLVVLNWSEKVLAPVLSILLVGTATTLGAVLITLKRSTLESSFPTSLVFDEDQGAPVLVIADPMNFRLTSRLMDLSRLGRPATNCNGKTVITITKPNNDDERFAFCGELLQYQILRIIQKLQRGGWSVGQLGGSSTANVFETMRLSNIQDYPGRQFLSVIASNRFSDSDAELFWWEHGHFPLPKNTQVQFIHQASSATSGPEKHIVRFEKPLFFRFDFVVEPLGATGAGVLPQGLALDPVVAAHCRTFSFKVAMEATFDRVTAGNWQTAEYKEWANWLLMRLRESLKE